MRPSSTADTDTAPARIACLVVPDFPLAALYRAEPALREVPLVLTDRPEPQATITAVSETAARLGVRPGQTAAQGVAVCAALVCRPAPGTTATGGPPRGGDRAHPIDYRRAAQAALREVALSCSPRVEDASERDPNGHGTIYLDARGAPFPSERALGAALAARAARLGLRARVGVAATKLAARLAAWHGGGVTVVAPGAERRFLAPLPISCLAPEPAIATALARWGLRRVGELACLSPAAMGARLGAAGAVLVRRARGEDTTPLVARAAPPCFEEEIGLEHGIDTLEPLIFVLRGCLDRLTARLAFGHLACGGLRLSLGLATRVVEERAVSVAAPTTDVKVLLALARLALENAPPAAPVETVRVAAEPAAVRAAQLDLYRPSGPAPERLAATLARLAAICGASRVGTPVVVDSHRPDALDLRPFDPIRRASPAAGSATGGACRLTLRAARPPRPIEVLDSGGEPALVRGRGVGGRVVALAGPWRLAGEWWTERGFARDYYDMSLSDGGVYRVYRDRRSGEWFMDGEYD
jgi:protein ImuB